MSSEIVREEGGEVGPVHDGARFQPPPGVRMYSFTTRSPLALVPAAILIVIIGGLLLTVGLALLAGLAIGGSAIGLAVMGYRKLRGQSATLPHAPTSSRRLDPSMEVFPTHPSVGKPPRLVESEE